MPATIANDPAAPPPIHSDDPESTGAGGLLTPIAVGLETTITPRATGTLYLRINDSAGSLSDNAGNLSVEIIAP
jgi:hypothetical protein